MGDVCAQNEGGMSPRYREIPSYITGPLWLDLAVSDMDRHTVVKAGIFRHTIVHWDDAMSGRWAAGNWMRLKYGLVCVERW